MNRPLLLALLLLLSTSQLHADPPRVDAEGVPLPDGVLTRIGSSKFRHAGMMRGVAYTPDGKRLITLATGSGLTCWNAANGAALWKVATKSEYDEPMRLHADGKHLVLIQQAGIAWHDLETGKRTKLVPFAEKVILYRTQISPRGDCFAVGSFRGVAEVFDTSTGERVHSFKATGGTVHNVAFRPDGKVLAVCSDEKMVERFDLATGEALRPLPFGPGRPASLKYSPDGTRLLGEVLVGDDSTTRIWDAETGREHCRIQGDGATFGIFASHFTADSRRVIVGSQWSYVAVYDTASGKELQKFHTRPTTMSLAFSPDEQTLAVGNNSGGISQWDFKNGQRLLASADPMIGVNVRRFLPNGQVQSYGEDFQFWNPISGRETRRSKSSPLTNNYFNDASPDGKWVALAEKFKSSSEFVLQDADSGKVARRVKVPGKYLHTLRFTPDSSRLVSLGSETSVYVWDVKTGEQVFELKGHEVLPMHQAMSADGRWLVTDDSMFETNRDPQCFLWDLRKGNLVRRITLDRRDIFDLALSPDAQQLAVVRRDRVLRSMAVDLYDVAKGSLQTVISTNGVYAVRYSPDGRMLVGSGEPDAITVWETASLRVRHRFIGHQSEVRDLGFSANSELLAASSNEAPCYVWDVYDKHLGKREAWTGADRDALWKALADPDAGKAFAALRRLVPNGDAAVELIAARLAPAGKPDIARAAPLLAQLESDSFAERQRAYAELEKLGDAIEAFLAQSAKSARSLESRQRIERLLAKLATPSAERLREIRAVEVLERVAARALLEKLAGGDADAHLTREAVTARARLQRP